MIPQHLPVVYAARPLLLDSNAKEYRYGRLAIGGNQDYFRPGTDRRVYDARGILRRVYAGDIRSKQGLAAAPRGLAHKW